MSELVTEPAFEGSIAITIAPDGVVWIGTVDHGLTRYNPAVAPLPTPPLPTPTPLATPGPIVSHVWLPLVSK